MASKKHLTLVDRLKIQAQLDMRKSFTYIATSLDKDPTTIKKEIKKHLIESNSTFQGRIHNDCIHRYECRSPKNCERCPDTSFRCVRCTKCNQYCDKFEKEICHKLDNPPYCCNGCKERQKCSLTKHVYDGTIAHQEYLKVLSESRQGITLSQEELTKIAKIIDIYVKEGHQSLHHAIINNQDCFNVCEKTLYNYIDQNLFNTRNIDLSRKVRMSPRKCHVHHKVDRNCTKGRTYADFVKYMEEHPGIDVVEIDSVEGPKGTSVLLTIFFRNCSVQLAFKRESNNARSVIEIFNDIYKKIGHDNFVKLFPVILADNGTEFSNPRAIECYIESDENGNIINEIERTKVFYCDPSAPYQKGACERNHEFIRMFVPKGESFDTYSQDDINLMMNHINSYSRGKEKNLYIPTSRFLLLYSKDLSDKLDIEYIDPNHVVLSKSIFKK